MRIPLISTFIFVLSINGSNADVQSRTANDGQLLMEGIPVIPASLPQTLGRYLNIRSAKFAEWSKDSKSIFIKTRFGDVDQLHRVDEPGGARYQLTFGDEPVGDVQRQPNSDLLALTRDRGGDEFDQVFLLNPTDGLIRLLSDGHALNNRMAWDREGERLAYRSTRRNGRSSDIWIQGTKPADEAKMVLETEDGTLWKPVDFSRDGKKLLIQQFISVSDSRIYIKDLLHGNLRLLAGDAENPSSNIATGFNQNDDGALFITNQRDGAAELAKVSLGEEPLITFVSRQNNWDLTQFVLSPNRKRGAFVANEGGISRLYLFDPEKLTLNLVEKIPLGLIGGLNFSPDSSKLGMTLNSARNPNEAFVLELGRKPLSAKKLSRWTYSEVGGLDTRKFSKPVPVAYTSTIEGQDQKISIPRICLHAAGRWPVPGRYTRTWRS